MHKFILRVCFRSSSSGKLMPRLEKRRNSAISHRLQVRNWKPTESAPKQFGGLSFSVLSIDNTACAWLCGKSALNLHCPDWIEYLFRQESFARWYFDIHDSFAVSFKVADLWTSTVSSAWSSADSRIKIGVFCGKHLETCACPRRRLGRTQNFFKDIPSSMRD